MLGRRSAPGTAGLVLAFLTFVAASSPWVVGVVHALYQIVFLGRTTVRSSVLFFPQTAVDLAGDALLAGAVLLLAVGALRTRVLGRWIPLLFIMAFLYILPPLFYAGYSLGFGSFPWLAFLPSWLQGPFWVLLGAVLWRRAPQTSMTLDPAASTARTGGAGG